MPEPVEVEVSPRDEHGDGEYELDQHKADGILHHVKGRRKRQFDAKGKHVPHGDIKDGDGKNRRHNELTLFGVDGALLLHLAFVWLFLFFHNVIPGLDNSGFELAWAGFCGIVDDLGRICDQVDRCAQHTLFAGERLFHR